MTETPETPAASGRAAPRFDVVVPCYNYARFLTASVESVLTQGVDVRVLIIDDCSQDNSSVVGAALAARDPRVTYRRHAVNWGHIATYNEGIEWAESDYLLLLSADDALMPGALARAADAFNAAPDIGMVVGRAIYFDESVALKDVLARRVAVHPWLTLHAWTNADEGAVPAATLEGPADAPAMVFDAARFFALNRTENVIHTCSAITRTADQKRLGGYLPSLPHSGDYEMWLRFAAHRPVAFVPHYLGAARMHGTNMYRQYDQVRDMIQKVAAVEALSKTCAGMAEPALLDDLRRDVAAQALRLTTVPFEQGATEDRLRLVAAARALDPHITRRPVWGAYRAKVAMGPRAWSMLRRFAHAVRRPVAGLAGIMG